MTSFSEKLEEKQIILNVNKCIALNNTTGKKCTYNAFENNKYCRRHLKLNEKLNSYPICQVICPKKNNICGKLTVSQTSKFCKRHNHHQKLQKHIGEKDKKIVKNQFGFNECQSFIVNIKDRSVIGKHLLDGSVDFILTQEDIEKFKVYNLKYIEDINERKTKFDEMKLKVETEKNNNTTKDQLKKKPTKDQLKKKTKYKKTIDRSSSDEDVGESESEDESFNLCAP